MNKYKVNEYIILTLEGGDMHSEKEYDNFFFYEILKVLLNNIFIMYTYFFSYK